MPFACFAFRPLSGLYYAPKGHLGIFSGPDPPDRAFQGLPLPAVQCLSFRDTFQLPAKFHGNVHMQLFGVRLGLHCIVLQGGLIKRGR
jgi:hypothetical protein